MKCERCAECLDEYLDGALTARETADLEEHIEACASCRAELYAARMVHGALSEPEPVSVPARFTRHILLEIERLEFRRTQRRGRILLAASMSAPLIITAIVIAAFPDILTSVGHFFSVLSEPVAREINAVAERATNQVGAGIEVNLDWLSPKLILRGLMLLGSTAITWLLLAVSHAAHQIARRPSHTTGSYRK